MTTYTSNYGWTKPSGSDNVDISVLNNNLDDQDSTIHDAFLNMAPPFSESSTYAVDDIVLYTTGLYKCHTAVVTPGSWTGSTNWQVYKLSEGGGGGGGTSDYSALNNKPLINGVTLTGNKTTGDLGINADNVMLSDGTTSVEDIVSGTFTAAENVTILHTKVKKQLNIVSLDIFCQKNLTANQWNHVGDISANFAPDSYSLFFPAQNDTDNGAFEARVQGTSIDVYPNVSGTKNFSIVTTYITTN